MKINARALAFTLGILWGLGMFLAVLWVMLLDGATGQPLPIAIVYRGVTVSWLGAVIGLAWGVLDGVIGGWLIGWLYNKVIGAGPITA